MKTAKTPYSYGQQDPKSKDASGPSSRSPISNVSRKGLVNFKPGDMSVATNDLGVTPNGIIRLQDVKFSSSFVRVPNINTDGSVSNSREPSKPVTS